MKRRILSSALALVMVLSLMLVPSITASAAEASVTVNVVNGTFNYDESKLGLLCDGVVASDATEFGDPRHVSFENKGFTHTDGPDAAVEGTLEFVLNLGEIKHINGATISLFAQESTMILAPTAVRFFASVDGDCWYDINARGIVTIPEGDSKEIDITVDFSTRAVFDVQYVKAVVTMKTGWIFASELAAHIVESPAEGANCRPEGPYVINNSEYTGISVYTAEDQPEGGFDLTEVAFKNNQLVKAKASDVAGKYEITFNKVNPWPDGHTGTMTLADDEVLVVIRTGGTLTTSDGAVDIYSAAKWAARCLTTDTEDDGKGSGDFVVINGDKICFYPAGHTVEAGSTPSGGEESKPTTPPDTGDATMVFALIALVAMGGAVVVRKRVR